MKLIIKLTSVTYAIKARDILKSKGIKSIVQKNPNPDKGEGCGYILVVQNAPEDTVNTLKFYGIDIKEAVWKK